MIENLLWPKKLTAPPQLLVDVEALFNGKLSVFNIPLIGEYAPQSSDIPWTQFRLIDVISDDTFRIGFVSEIIGGPLIYKHIIALPFQNIEVSIDEFRCHGWDEGYANTLSAPTETEVKKTLANKPLVTTYQGTAPDGHSSLFKMTGPELEAGGQQFSSNGAYTGIDYQFTSSYINNLKNEFPQMWEKYDDRTNKTLAVETVVNVKVYSDNTADGFKLGIA